MSTENKPRTTAQRESNVQDLITELRALGVHIQVSKALGVARGPYQVVHEAPGGLRAVAVAPNLSAVEYLLEGAILGADLSRREAPGE